MKGMKEEQWSLPNGKVENPVQCAMPERGGICNDTTVQDTTLNYISIKLALSELEDRPIRRKDIVI